MPAEQWSLSSQAADGPSCAQAAAYTCTSAALVQRLLRWRTSEADQRELQRRKWLLALYLLRDPLFSNAIACAALCMHACICRGPELRPVHTAVLRKTLPAANVARIQ